MSNGIEWISLGDNWWACDGRHDCSPCVRRGPSWSVLRAAIVHRIRSSHQGVIGFLCKLGLCSECRRGSRSVRGRCIRCRFVRRLDHWCGWCLSLCAIVPRKQGQHLIRKAAHQLPLEHRSQLACDVLDPSIFERGPVQRPGLHNTVHSKDTWWQRCTSTAVKVRLWLHHHGGSSWPIRCKLAHVSRKGHVDGPRCGVLGKQQCCPRRGSSGAPCTPVIRTTILLSSTPRRLPARHMGHSGNLWYRRGMGG